MGPSALRITGREGVREEPAALLGSPYPSDYYFNMDAGPALATRTEGEGREDAGRTPRQHFRHSLACLAYVRLDHANGGIIRNISLSGVGIQAVGRLHAGQVMHLRFDLLRPKVRIEATGQVAWANEFGQAGIAFLNLPPRPQRVLKEWLMTDLLAAASELAPGKAPILHPIDHSIPADGLMVSAAPVPSITVGGSVGSDEESDATSDAGSQAEMPLRFSWWPADISPGTFARFVDFLVVASAVLLFSIIAIESTGIIPSPWIGTAFAAFLAGAFGMVYYFLFTGLSGHTLGRKLARMAAEDLAWMATSEEESTRFR